MPDATGVLELRGSEELLLVEASPCLFPPTGIGPRGVGVVRIQQKPGPLILAAGEMSAPSRR